MGPTLVRHYQSNKRVLIVVVVIVFGLAALLSIAPFSTSNVDAASDSSFEPVPSFEEERARGRLRSLTWNIAAINNNPFEYWITSDNPTYNELMQSVSMRIMSPTSKEDATVGSVFTDSMMQQLADLMRNAGFEGVDETIMRYHHDFSMRKIYSGFLADPVLGKKRLISMADRTTNTIQVLGGDSAAYRPTVINCYTDTDLGSLDSWWARWKTFMFSTKISVASHDHGSGAAESRTITAYQLLDPIKKSKYPAITAEEEKISVALQTLATAIFDAILVDMMNKVAPTSWQVVRSEMCNQLNRNKLTRTAEILENTYAHTDVVFLQEVASSFSAKANSRALGRDLFDVLRPQRIDPNRDQNSFILLRKGMFKTAAKRADTLTQDKQKESLSTITEAALTEEVTDSILETLKAAAAKAGTSVPVATGDLFAITATHKFTSTQYLFVSFHGDTNGLATIPIVNAVRDYALQHLPHHKLLFGLDANTYSSPAADQQGVTEFAKHYASLGMNSCWGISPNPLNYTTYHARTHLQTQLNKAVSYHQMKDGLKGGDKNPKDFILFFEVSNILCAMY